MNTSKKIIAVAALIAVPVLIATALERKSQAPQSTASAALTAVNSNRIIKADQEPQNWLSHGRTYSEERFSPLNKINDGNVKDLGLAWYLDVNTKRGLEATPIVVDGVMYTTGSWSIVFAIDARTGKLIWKYDPQVPKATGIDACCDVVNRGVAIYEGKLFLGALDGRLIALDAPTGKLLWETNTSEGTKPYTITGAPRVIKGKVIIGNAGAEYGARGYVSAYDSNTGKQLWRFYTVPGDPAKPAESKAMEMAAKTWKGSDEWLKAGAGGTVWDSMAYDPELDLLYFGSGNGLPWDRNQRSPGGGDNLFLASIIAVKPDTGEYVWHYQVTPAESWDYDATQHLVLADLQGNEGTQKVIMQASKNGFFYVLDRATGKFISAQAYVKTNWATHVDAKTGRPVETEIYTAEKEKLTYPSPFGAHNWQPMSFNPNTGLVYIPTMDIPFMFKGIPEYHYNRKTWNVAIDPNIGQPKASMDQMLNRKIAKALARGHLTAWDPVKQKEVWRAQDIGPWTGGILSTAGNLVFQGKGDGYLVAYNASNGKKLWESATQTGVIASPVTYTVDGEQYVAVMAGWGGAFALVAGAGAEFAKYGPEGRLLVYKLGGSEKLPPYTPPTRMPEPPELTASEDVVNRGNDLYHMHCFICHGTGAVGTSDVSDLRYMNAATHKSFNDIVMGGAFRSRGMAGFAGIMNEEDVNAIHAYLIKRGHDEIAEKEANSLWLQIKGFFYSLMASGIKLLVGLTT